MTIHKFARLIRAGETDQAVSIDDPDLIALGLKITQNLQLFEPKDVDVKLKNGVPKLLEMNPRFGGGYPCAQLAGANYPAKLITLCKNEILTPDFNACPPDIIMLKQDEIISPPIQTLDYIQDCKKSFISPKNI